VCRKTVVHGIAVIKSGVNKRCANCAGDIKVKKRAAKITECGRNMHERQKRPDQMTMRNEIEVASSGKKRHNDI